MSERKPSPFKTLFEGRRRNADPRGRRRLPDPLQEPCGERLSRARQQADHHDRRRAVDQLSVAGRLPEPSRHHARDDRHGGAEPRASRSYRRGLSFPRQRLHRRAPARRQQDHAARRLLDAAQDVQRTERADRHRHLARGRQSDRPRQFPPQRDVHAGPYLGLHLAVRSGQGVIVRRRHADAPAA
ncbi:hypothetical protein ACVWW1_004790 [Bradyrhizobium sp. JR3.5]